jgi:hypothetical protein
LESWGIARRQGSLILQIAISDQQASEVAMTNKLTLVAAIAVGGLALSGLNTEIITKSANAEGIYCHAMPAIGQMTATPSDVRTRLSNQSSRSEPKSRIQLAGNCWCEDFRSVCDGTILNGICQHFVNVCVRTVCSNN